MWPYYRIQIVAARNEAGDWRLLLFTMTGVIEEQEPIQEDHKYIAVGSCTVHHGQAKELIASLAKTGSMRWHGYSLTTETNNLGSRGYPDPERPHGHPTTLETDGDYSWWQAWFDFSYMVDPTRRMFTSAQAEATSLGFHDVAHAARGWIGVAADTLQCKICFRFPLPLTIASIDDSSLQVQCYDALSLQDAKVTWNSTKTYSSKDASISIECVTLRNGIWSGQLKLPETCRAVFFEFVELRGRQCPYYLLPKSATSATPSNGHSRMVSEQTTTLRKDYGDTPVAFIMMEFGDSHLHRTIDKAIRDTLADHGLIGVRADDREYATELYANVKVYMDECALGVAVFERIVTNEFNPNVSFEVGYLIAQGKSVCLLKDETLETLPTDLVGKLYRKFSIQDISRTIRASLSKWLEDHGHKRLP